MMSKLGKLCFITLIAFILAGSHGLVHAQTLVVANFSGKSKRLAKRARQAVVRALSAKGVKLVSYKQYLRKARRNRIRASRALKARSIRKMSRRMKLNGVVTGSVKKKGRRYIITVRAFGSNGKLRLKKAYRVKRQNFPRKTARRLAGLIVRKVGGQAAVAKAPPPEPPPDLDYEEESGSEAESESAGLTAEDPEQAAPEETGTKTSEAFLPRWARDEGKEAAASEEEEEEAEAPPTTTKRAPRKRRKSIGSTPDPLIAAGLALNTRGGMDPRHESGIFPSFRLDGRFFLAAFMQMDWVDGIGLGGSFNRSFMLQYGPENGGDKWESTQQQWMAEGLYRLALNDVALKPAFIVRFGYGATTCEIDTDDRLAVSAAYTYPFAGLEIYLTLYEEIVRLGASANYLLSVSASGEISGSGSGFNVRAGLDLELFSPIQLSIGYELTQVKFEGTVHQEDKPEISDTYQNFFARAGWRFH
jgi:hypothetical protein